MQQPRRENRSRRADQPGTVLDRPRQRRAAPFEHLAGSRVAPSEDRERVEDAELAVAQAEIGDRCGGGEPVEPRVEQTSRENSAALVTDLGLHTSGSARPAKRRNATRRPL